MKLGGETVKLDKVILEKQWNLGLPEEKRKLIAENIVFTIPEFQIESIGSEEDDRLLASSILLLIKSYLARKAALDQHYGNMVLFNDWLGERGSWIFSDSTDVQLI